LAVHILDHHYLVHFRIDRISLDDIDLEASRRKIHAIPSQPFFPDQVHLPISVRESREMRSETQRLSVNRLLGSGDSTSVDLALAVSNNLLDLTGFLQFLQGFPSQAAVDL